MRRFSFARLLAAAAAVCAVAGVSAALAQPASNSLNNRWPGDPEPEDTAPPPPAQQRQQPAPRQAPAQVQRPQQPTPQQPAQVQRPQQSAPQQPAPRPQQAAPQQQPPIAAEAPAATAPAPPPKPRPPVQAAAPHAITCSGVFAKDSSHTKLAAAFGNGNVAWTQVDGPDATKLNASVLFPRDAKRRLEVLWTNEDERTDTQVIVINGQSTWTGPKGVKLGVTLAALEKLNGRPFTMKGFKGDNGGLVTSWDGGALDRLPGNCRIGVRFGPDPKAPAPREGETDALVSDKDFLSNAPAVRSLSPKIAEIIIGY